MISARFKKMTTKRLVPLFCIVVLVASAQASAARTVMFLVDYWLSQPMDTVIGLNVTQPATEITYLPGGAPPSPQLSNAYVNPTYEQFAWWYSLNNFSPDDYGQGRIRIKADYTRGWYQMDGYDTVKTDTLLNLASLRMDTAKTLTYRNPVTQMDTTVSLPATGPDTVRLPKGAWFRAPLLYVSQGGGETPLLNQRGSTSTGGTTPGNIDNCLDSLVGDTVWFRFAPKGTQQPTTVSCTNYNPFAVLRARVFLRNPWPGSSPTVQWNGQEVQLFPWPSNPDFLYADLRYIPSQGQPPLKFRFHMSAGSAQYFDSAGVNAATVAPFNFPAAPNGKSYWFVPPEGGAASVSGTSTPPLTPSYTLYVQNPWTPGSPRVVWPGDPTPRVMRPTQFCGWYQYPLYSQPTQMLIGHSFEDSLFGTNGVMFRTRVNFVTMTLRASDNTYWVGTKLGTSRIPAFSTTSPTTTACGTDTLKLVMEAFDFKGRADVGGNPSFQIGGWTDLKGAASSGLAKGMVQKSLGPNGLPVYTGRDSGYQAGGINGQGKGIAYTGPGGYGKSTPTNWFDTTALHAAIPGIAIGHSCVELPLTKTPADPGYYDYASSDFFPLDTISDTRGVSMATADDNQSHNFNFCMHGHAAFEYTPGLKFEFRGDDDVWVFINKTLAIDLGGTHAPESTFVDIDKLHLLEGQVYPFDIFYCERQTNGSSILIRTSMDLEPSWQYKDTLLSNTGGVVKLQILGLKSQNYRPSCADLTSGKTTWQAATGRMVVIGPDGSPLLTVYSSDTTVYGSHLSFINGLLTADTINLKLSPDLGATGKYTILAESIFGDLLDSISFTKSYGSVIVQGTVFDGNGDGIADSIRLVAPALIFADNPSYHVVWFNAAGKKDSIIDPAGIRKISDSIAIVPIDSKNWGIRTALPLVRPDSLGTVLTHPGGVASAVANPIKLLDGIAPVADSAWLVYDTTGSGMDTLYVIPSEPVQIAAIPPALGISAWILDGKSAAPNLLPGVGTISPDGLLIKLPLVSASDPIVPGDSIRLGGKLADLIGNAPGTNSRWVPVQANTVAKSWMLDTTGDGAPDVIHISSRGSFAAATSVTVHWKTSSGADTTFSVATPAGLGSSLTLPAKILGNATYCTGCHIDVVSPTGTKTFVLLDSVAPVAISAAYKYGTVQDTLVVTASESLFKGIARGENWVAQKSVGDLGVPGSLVINGTVSGTPTKVLTLLVPPGTFVGDSLRLRGWSADTFGNAPGAVSKWVPVIYSTQPLRIQVFDRNSDGRADSVVFSLTRSASGAPSPNAFSVQWGGQTLSVSNLSRSADGLFWSGPIGPFAPAVTAPIAGEMGWMRIGTDSTSWKARVEDSVPPVATKAVYRYGLTTDTLTITASEALVPGNALGEGWVAQKNAPSLDALGTVAVGTVWGTPSKVLTLLVTPGSFTGDSLRLRAWSKDAVGNTPGAVSPWVPVIYSTQPLRIQVFDRNSDGRADSVVFSLTRSASGAPSPNAFSVQWGGQTLSVSNLSHSADGLSWSGPIGPFAPAVTAPIAGEMGWMRIGTDSTSWKARVEDSVPPVATKAVYRYGLTMDTLIVTATEPLVQGNAAGEGWVAQKNAPSQSASGTVAIGNAPWVPTNILTLLVSPGAFTGDSLRLRAWSKDAVGNTPGAVSPWVPVAYGPQQIRVQLFDKNGDGRADNVVFRLTRSAAGAPVPTGFSVTWNGQTISVLAAGLTRSSDGLSWSGPVGPFALGTAPIAGDVGWIAVGADNTSFSALVEDSVAPVARTASLVFGFDPGSPDTLIVTGSEGLSLKGINYVLLNKDSSNTGAYSPTGASLDSTGGLGKILKLVVASGSIASDAAWVRFGTSVSDKGGATVGASSLWVRLMTKPSGRAYLYDSDGDGRADSVGIQVRGTLAATSAVLTWTDASGKSDTRTWPVATTAGTMGLHPPQSTLWFAKGATSCPAGNCTISFRDAIGTELVNWPLVDSVAPIAISGTYAFGTSQDTLRVTFSEPLTALSKLSSWVEWGNATISGAVVHDTVFMVSGVETATFILDTARGAHAGWDSVRIATGSLAGKITDSKGVKAGAKSPWAPLTYGLPPLVAKITDPQGKGRGTNVEVRLARSVPTTAISTVSGFHLTWDGVGRDVPVSSLVWDATSKVWTGSVGIPFALGATGPGTVYGAQVASSDGITRVIGLEDGAPPSIVRARYRYSTPEVARDTLIVDLSEAWEGEAQGNKQDPFVFVRDSANPLPFAPMIDWVPMSGDHKTLSLVVDTTWETKLKVGDSARLAYSASGSRIWDASLNRVGVNSRWVPIEFGLRPIEFVIKQEHAMLVNKDATTWPEPGPDVPQMEILVRQDGTNNWVRVDENLQTSSDGTISGGTPAKNLPDHVMAVYLRLNRPLSGELFVYDNIGTSVVRKGLEDLRKLWPAGTDDMMREVRITWNGTGPTGQFVATGVYLLRAVVKVNDGVGHMYYKNLLWKYGWQHGVN